LERGASTSQGHKRTEKKVRTIPPRGNINTGGGKSKKTQGESVHT